MSSSKEVAKQGAWAKFMHWYESYQGKRVVACVYSLGASVVIVGALFKIMHFPGAGVMLTVGMGIEALLFAIGCLDKPHAEFHWENVFPQLVAFGSDPKVIEELADRPRPTLLGDCSGSSSTTVPMMDDKSLASLKEGIANLSKTANQLSELGTIAVATEKLNVKLDAAGDAAEQFVLAGTKIGAAGEELSATYAQVNANMQKVVAGTQAHENQLASIATQLSSLNSVYELQLKALQSQVEAYKAQTEKVCAATSQVEAMSANVKAMLADVDTAKKNQEAYSAGIKELAGHVADLNKVYGSMLNSLS